MLEDLLKKFDLKLIGGHLYKYTYVVYKEVVDLDPLSNCGFTLKKVSNRKFSSKEAYRFADIVTRIFPNEEILVIDFERRIF